MRLRHRCSPLKADEFRVNLICEPSCTFGCPVEDVIHFVLKCPLCIYLRAQLLNNIQPNAAIEYLLFGSDMPSDEVNKTSFFLKCSQVYN